MSDLPSVLPDDLVRPEAPRSWRDHLGSLAEALDISPRRLVLGVVVLAVAAVVGWRLLAPPPAPPEMQLPLAPSAGAPAGGEAGGPPGSGPGHPEAAPGSTAAPPDEVVVHVAGAVAVPGVQRLPGGARVVDALDASGGANPDADLGRINLAAPLQDGQQVYVPRLGEVPPVPSGASGGAAAPSGAGGGPGAGAPASPVNLNTATAEQLDTLPGVGPTTAAAIIAHREQNGPFTSVDQLLDVRGIGEAKLEQLRELVTV